MYGALRVILGVQHTLHRVYAFLRRVAIRLVVDPAAAPLQLPFIRTNEATVLRRRSWSHGFDPGFLDVNSER